MRKQLFAVLALLVGLGLVAAQCGAPAAEHGGVVGGPCRAV